MIKINNYMGFIEISNRYFSNLIGKSVSECFGVKKMISSSIGQKIKNLVSKTDVANEGILVKNIDGKLFVDVHIEVSYGVNISAIVKSIISKVRYIVEDVTGLEVGKVNVYIDNISV